MRKVRKWWRRVVVKATLGGMIGLAPACGADAGGTQGSAADVVQSADAEAGQDATGADGSANAGSDAGEQADAAAPQKTYPPLLTPSLLEDTNPDPQIVEVTLVAQAEKRTPVEGGPEVEMFLYNGTFPGPTLKARRGDRVIVHFENKLPEKTTVHWHGLRISDQMDGSPRIQKPVEPGESFTYDFVVPDAGTYWYHPHVRANEQVEKGLYGMIVIDESEPVGVTRERTLNLDDIYLGKDGWPAWLASHPEVMHGRNGNVLLLNGKTLPLSGEMKKGDVERWRLVNTANARTMHFDVEGPAFVRILGTDGGLLPLPYDISGKIIDLPVGQRYDLEVVAYAAGKVTLRSHVPVQKGGGVVLQPFSAFEVTVADDPSVTEFYAAEVGKVEPLPDRQPNLSKTMIFDAVQDASMPGGVAWRINGKSMWMEPIFTFAEGATVDLLLDNQLGPEHPFHLHGQFFTILERDGKAVTDEPGLKDTVLVPGLAKVKIRAYFDNPGQWMAHCHILEHAELGFMSEIVVTPAQ